MNKFDRAAQAVAGVLRNRGYAAGEQVFVALCVDWKLDERQARKLALDSRILFDRMKGV